MKHSIFIIFLITHFSHIQAQTHEVFVKQAFDWQEIDTEIDQETRDKFIHSVLQEPSFGRIKNISLEYISDNFHFLDLNGDQELDAVYNGGYGGENEIIHLITIKNKELIVSDPLFGLITDFQVLENKVDLKIYDYGCCAQLVDVYASFEVFCDSEEIELKNLYAYARIKETQNPEDFIQEIRFEVQNDGYKLRAQPEIITDYDGLPEEVIMDGNTLAMYPKSSTGTAIAEKMDQTGRLWWFVIMDSNFKPISSLFTNGNNNISEYKCAGWMSSRFLTAQN